MEAFIGSYPRLIQLKLSLLLFLSLLGKRSWFYFGFVLFRQRGCWLPGLLFIWLFGIWIIWLFLCYRVFLLNNILRIDFFLVVIDYFLGRGLLLCLKRLLSRLPYHRLDDHIITVIFLYQIQLRGPIFLILFIIILHILKYNLRRTSWHSLVIRLVCVESKLILHTQLLLHLVLLTQLFSISIEKVQNFFLGRFIRIQNAHRVKLTLFRSEPQKRGFLADTKLLFALQSLLN